MFYIKTLTTKHPLVMFYSSPKKHFGFGIIPSDIAKRKPAD